MNALLGIFFRKFIEVFLSLLLLVTLTFIFLRFLPGGPFDEDVALNPAIQVQLEKSWHLHSSIPDQYYHYMTGLLQGDLGRSMVRPDRDVLQILKQGLAQTLTLNALALVIIYVGAFAAVLLWARYRDHRVGFFIDQTLIALISMPSLFLAPMLILVFAFWLDLLPSAFLTTPAHFILPLLALSLRPLAYLARLLQRSVKEQLQSDYARTARAKGLGHFQILFNHILRNSLVPVISYSGPLLVSLLSGSFLVEVLFAIPGLGSEFVSGLNERDYTLICGLALFYGSVLILANLAFDGLMRLVDPRLKDRA